MNASITFDDSRHSVSRLRVNVFGGGQCNWVWQFDMYGSLVKCEGATGKCLHGSQNRIHSPLDAVWVDEAKRAAFAELSRNFVCLSSATKSSDDAVVR